jgi:hypothetical protein
LHHIKEADKGLAGVATCVKRALITSLRHTSIKVIAGERIQNPTRVRADRVATTLDTHGWAILQYISRIGGILIQAITAVRLHADAYQSGNRAEAESAGSTPKPPSPPWSMYE